MDAHERFSYVGTEVVVDPDVAESHREVWRRLGETGTWWTASQRLAIAHRARAQFAARGRPPWDRQVPDDGQLSEEAASAVDVLATNPSAVDGRWAERHVEALGDGPYVELVAVCATTVMVDMFAEAVGVDREPLPASAADGELSRERPDGLGDIGAHVPMLDPFPYANVARALSLVPAANALFRVASVPMYSAPGMGDLVWNTPLDRAQVELIATRVAALNECFY